MIFYQFLPTNSVRKCIEISLENLFVDIGAERVKLQNVIKSQTFEGAGEGGGGISSSLWYHTI